MIELMQNALGQLLSLRTIELVCSMPVDDVQRGDKALDQDPAFKAAVKQEAAQPLNFFQTYIQGALLLHVQRAVSALNVVFRGRPIAIAFDSEPYVRSK